MYGQYNKVNVARALQLRAVGLSNSIIAKRLDVTPGAVYRVLREHDVTHGPPQKVRRRPDICWV